MSRSARGVPDRVLIISCCSVACRRRRSRLLFLAGFGKAGLFGCRLRIVVPVRANFLTHWKGAIGLFGLLLCTGIVKLLASEERAEQLAPVTVGVWVASSWNPAPVLAAIVAGVGGDAAIKTLDLSRAEDNPAKLRIELSGGPFPEDQKLRTIEMIRSMRFVVEEDPDESGDERLVLLVWLFNENSNEGFNDDDAQFIDSWLPYFPVTQEADGVEIAFTRILEDSGLPTAVQKFQRIKVPPGTGGGFPVAEVTIIRFEVEGSLAELLPWLDRIQNRSSGKTLRLERMTVDNADASKARATLVFYVPFLKRD